MARIVEAEARDKLTGLLLEYFRQIRQKSGYPFDLDKLVTYLKEGIEGRFWSGLFDDVVRRHGITRKQLYEIICMNGSAFLEAVNKIVLNQTAVAKARNVFHILVNYDRSVEDGVWAGRYDWSNSDITSGHFLSDRRGTTEADIHLIHFNKVMSAEQVLIKLDRMGFRPAGIQHALAFGEKYPDIQREFPIVFLGSVWQSPRGHRDCPCLDGSDARRELSLDWVGAGWDEDCRLAAVRK
jgi:hypothetical protein